jgi:hypothetical protein
MSLGAKDVVPLPQGRAERLGLTAEAHHLLLDDVTRGLADITAGRTEDADSALARLQQRRAHRPQR